MTDMTDAQLAKAIRRGLHENWQRMARLRKAKARSRPAAEIVTVYRTSNVAKYWRPEP
jgi:hypothetical protein